MVVLCGFINWGGAGRGETVEGGMQRREEKGGERGQIRGGGGGRWRVPPGANRFPAALKHLLAPVSWNGVRFHLWQITQTED